MVRRPRVRRSSHRVAALRRYTETEIAPRLFRPVYGRVHYAPPEGLIEPQDTSLGDMLTNEKANVMTVNAAISFCAVAALGRTQMEPEKRTNALRR